VYKQLLVRVCGQANHRSKFAARGREEEALTAIEDKKVELYGMITKARRNEHRIGWRNRGLLWYLSSTPRPHDLKRYTQKHI
jgi:hypothetical protein